MIATFKTAFTDENVKVRTQVQPYLLRDCFGVKYHQFTAPSGVKLAGDSFALADEERNAELFMELLETEDAQVVSGYDHYAWKKYAAVTRKDFGKGLGIYFGCMTSPAYLKALLASLWKEKGWWTWKQEIPFPLVIREGTNGKGKRITYYLNYSGEAKACACGGSGRELFSQKAVTQGEILTVAPWDLLIVEA